MIIRNGVILKKGYLISVIIIFAVSLLTNSATFGQNTSVTEMPVATSNQSQIILSKVATSNTILTNKTVLVGGFDTTFSITGSPLNIKDSKELIISSIVEDYTKSSTAGYVMVSKSMSNSSGKQELANPFATNEQIGQKINELLSKSIEWISNSRTGIVSINCSFGSSLDLFSCSTRGY